MTNEEINVIEDEKARIYAPEVWGELELLVFEDMREESKTRYDYWFGRLD